MAYPLEFKEKAVNLRKRGYSIKEVAKTMDISQSTSSHWLRDIKLNKKARERLKKRRLIGQYKAHLTQKIKRQEKTEKFKDKAAETLSGIRFNTSIIKLLCSILFWTEGAKSTSHITFVNSDPNMVATFTKLLRLSFEVDEKKFRALVHIHEYHNDKEIKKFWSKISGIPLSQFNKSYQKPHTQKRKRKDYKGCLVVRYYDYRIALELNMIYNVFATNTIGV